MKTFRWLLVGLASGLTSCASTNDVLNKPVDEVFHSIASVDEVARCFEIRGHTRVIERPDGARVATFRNGYGGVVRAFSIYPEGTGSRIEVRHDFIDVPGYVWKQCVGLKPTGSNG